ncbi:hypothetical protein H5410_002057 [Solanum commersonii]|uniref:Pectinesterase inhibitor domain-containing protein n=1 Tax=Solanum commersonii TaxID=4109 RepID=A0A9J6B0Z9_SOLCO|nr:hypothetical protein H5410_002057 [Solanum commersonii]
MNSLKALIVMFMLFLSLVTYLSGDLIEDVCRTSRYFKVCIDALRSDPKSSSADKKDNAETTIKDFNAIDFPGARSSIAGVASAPDTCEETFNEPSVRISSIKSKDDDSMNFIDLTVSLMNQFTN